MPQTKFLFKKTVFGAITLSLLATGIAPVGIARADKPKPPTPASKKQDQMGAPLTEEQRILHVLNRLGFGPRPGDIEKVKSMGLQKYVDLQLNPEKIDDAAVETRLASFTHLHMPNAQLFETYDNFVHSSQTAQQNKKKTTKANAKKAVPDANAGQSDATSTTTSNATPNVVSAKGKAAGKKKQADAAPAATTQETRREVREAGVPIGQVHEELMADKMIRAIESERQLQEVMVDFWSNHFNIDMRRPPCGILKVVDDREVIRPHIFSKFRDMLGASAKSPAMLVYLDNFLSTKDMTEEEKTPAIRKPANRKKRLAADATPATPNTPAVPPKKAKGKAPAGLNENYAREIMELHTLGVDGGYTQQDVREVARCFTGWSISSADGKRITKPRYMSAGGFRYFANLHDNGSKTVLGHTIPAGGGEKDGEMVLDILANHPSTMKHVSYQLCQRLVNDNPPASLIDKCVATWKQTDGDLRAITRTIVTSPEFYSSAAFRAKIKSPFEYAVSSVRALGGTYASPSSNAASSVRLAALMVKPPKGGGYLDIDTTSLLGQVGTMGQPIFQYQAPTGYPEDSQKWVSSGALISRLNFALTLTANRLTDVRSLNMMPASDASRTTPEQLMDQMAKQILHHPIAPATRATVLEQLNGTGAKTVAAVAPAPDRIAALLLGSPEFQRH